MPAKEATPFQQALDARVASAASGLVERLPDKRLRCLACGHRCLILPGLRGICRVRYNREGELLVPYGYVGALQCDPTEKKPFFHALPGSDALTFGMLGCDLHCSYCLTGESRVATGYGMRTLAELWESGSPDPGGDEDKRCPEPSATAIADDGTEREIRWVFRHAYEGSLVRVVPRMLPAIEATHDHMVLATDQPGVEPARMVPASDLTTRHFLAVPRIRVPGRPVVIDVDALLRSRLGNVKVRRHAAIPVVEEIVRLTAAGDSSAVIATQVGLSASHVRHLRSRLVRRGGDVRALIIRPELLIFEEGRLRFGQERRPGIPAQLPLTAELAELLGYYCAEGGVLSARDRPNSHSLTFTFGPVEIELVERCRALVEQLFSVATYVSRRSTTLAVSVSKASLALLFRGLCGSGSPSKHVPRCIQGAELPVVASFLSAFVAGDGHRYSNGKVSITTVSEQLAWDIAWLVMRLGYLPGIYCAERPLSQVILGRTVNCEPRQYTVVWYERPVARRLFREDDEFFYLPIRELSQRQYRGYVYNLETAGRHTFTANGVAVHNCQNWVTSQAPRDPGALADPLDVTPRQLVDIAQRHGARIVATSYNEPLITSEWAVDVFKEARRQGFMTAYVSNGNATREVLEYIRPFTDLYKIDLKSMRDRNYRSLGGKLENILAGVRMVHELGFWLEIVTLVIPGFNDSDEELRDAASFLVSVSPDIPWHVTAFHKDYRMQDPHNTTPAHLLRATRIGEEAGLRYVYAGNLPGRVSGYENTRCPACRTTLVRRYGYRILEDRLSGFGRCPRCGQKIPGIWDITVGAKH